MAFEFRFPDIGEGIAEGELLSWKVKEGDQVAQDQTLAEMETDKAVVEMPSPRAGRVLKLHAAQGDIVNVGDVLVTIEEGAPAAGEAAPARPATAPARRSRPRRRPPPARRTGGARCRGTTCAQACERPSPSPTPDRSSAGWRRHPRRENRPAGRSRGRPKKKSREFSPCPRSVRLPESWAWT